MDITPEDWPVLSKLLDDALDLAPDEREHWLGSLRESHARLLGPLRDLLLRHVRIETSDFLLTMPRLGAAAGDAVSGASALKAGAAVGPYVIEEEIGRGGMGVVWRARRADGIVKRAVALKLLHAGLYSEDLLARFNRERDILAELAHPNIARLYDAGATATGQPFIALEYVEGLPLTDYCNRNRLDLRQRLALIVQVLQAVHYAHSHLVIHRDLKPSNILVTADGQVRLLDFGIAKLLPAQGGGDSAMTELGARALTPDYAAPELITGGAVTTATDVYSAGVVLYELLTGQRPYRLNRETRGALEEAIVSADPDRPSRVVTDKKLQRSLAGDLDTIALKALKKLPAERYASADAMLLDINRYLRNEPVLARPDRAWYRLRKFIVRHALTVNLATAFLLVLVGGLGAALWEAHAARAQAARADAAKGFLIKVFSAGNTANTQGKNITASEILERGARQLDVELKDQPLLLGELHDEIADIYSSFGANEDVLAHSQRAAALLGQYGARDTDAYLDALYRIADSYKEREQWPEARAAYQNLRAAAAAHFGPQNVWEGKALEDLAWSEAVSGNLPAAESLTRQSLALMKALYGERSGQYLRVLGASVQLYLDGGRPADALPVVRKLIELAPQVPSYALPDRLMDRYMLGSTLYRMQRFQESADTLRALVPDMEHNMGLRNDRTSKARNTLALDLKELGELDEALAIQRHNLEYLQNSRDGDPDLIAGQQATLTRILGRIDQFGEAIPLQREIVKYFDRKYPSPTYLREMYRFILGDLLIRSGTTAEGVVAVEQSIGNMNRLEDYKPDAAYADMLQSLADGYRLLGRRADAQSTIAKACGLYESLLDAHAIATLRCRVYQVLAGASADPLVAFAPLRDELQRALPPHQALRAELSLVEAQLDRETGHTAEAGILEREGASAYRTLVGVAPLLPLRALH